MLDVKIRQLFIAIEPLGTSKYRITESRCEYRDKEDNLLIIVKYIIEDKGSKKYISIGGIKVGVMYLHQGLCKKFLKDMYAIKGELDIIIDDVVSDKMFSLLSDYFVISKLDIQKPKGLNESWSNYNKYYGSFILEDIKR